jgi:hypothetical protein
MYIHIHLHFYINVHIYIYTYVYIHMYIYIYTNIYTYRRLKINLVAGYCISIINYNNDDNFAYNSRTLRSSLWALRVQRNTFKIGFSHKLCIEQRGIRNFRIRESEFIYMYIYVYVRLYILYLCI